MIPKHLKTISITGLGHIGLPTAAAFAHAGFYVRGIDINFERVASINDQTLRTGEPGLDTFICTAVEQGRLEAFREPQRADAHIIAVPTGINPDKSPDLSHLQAAITGLATVLEAGNLVVIESTVPPRTCLDVVASRLEELTGLDFRRDFHLAHCPERVLPGNILHEIIHNDRIVGGATHEATKRTTALYGSFVKGQILQTDITTAEMCKLMENTYRDVNIALANEYAGIAQAVGVDVFEAIRLANHHPRVDIHTPGIGVGGHCIPIDPWYLVHAVENQSNLIRRARDVNDARPIQVAAHILDIVASTPVTAPLALLGLTYKSGVNDLRQSPALQIAESLAGKNGNELLIVEPHISTLPQELTRFPHVELTTMETALARDAFLILLVEHDAFAAVTPDLRMTAAAGHSQTGMQRMILTPNANPAD